MATQRTKAELQAIVANGIKPNNNKEVTASIHQSILLDFIESVSFLIVEDGLMDYSQTSSGIVPVGTSLGVSFLNNVRNGATVIINGVSYILGDADTFDFYAKDVSDTVVRAFGEIIQGDVLHYNSTSLEFVIDTVDKLTINYLVEL